MIQSNVQLSEIYREKYEKTGLGIEDSLQCAKAAIHCVRTTTAVEDFTNHVIHFNAKTALMKAYSACNETDEAKSIAENIINEYEANPNCGAKPLHLEAAETILAQVGCSLAP